MDRRQIVSVARGLGDSMIAKGTPCYLEITEGRTDWQKPDGSVGRYSWCGDFVTYVYFICGATNGAGLNRVALNGEWQIGRNIDMLVSAARAYDGYYEGKAALERILNPEAAGDVVIREAAGGGHVGILLRSLSATLYETADGNSIGGTTRVNVRNLTDGKTLAVCDASTYWGLIAQAGGTPPVIARVATEFASYMATRLPSSAVRDDSWYDESSRKA